MSNFKGLRSGALAMCALAAAGCLALFIPGSKAPVYEIGRTPWMSHIDSEIASKPMPVYSTSYQPVSDVEELARCMYFEAYKEGDEGMIMVGNVVMNRVNKKGYPNTIYGVIHHKNMFSVVHRSNYYTKKIPKKCFDLAQQVIDGETAVCCDNVLYFNNSGPSYYMRETFWYGNHCFGHGKGGCKAD